MLLSPEVEVLFRRIYWANYSLINKFHLSSSHEGNQNKKIDLNAILKYLKSVGIKEGSLLIVHSSYAALASSGLSPTEIVSKLRELVGDEGTLCMPVIRSFKGEPEKKNILTTNLEEKEFIYDVNRTRIKSGFLAFTLSRLKDSVVSMFPLNPMAAVGPLASEMMKHNLDGEFPSPHGPNSSWKFCYDHNAFIIGLGVDLNHHMTMVHTIEEAFGDWPIKNWYRKRLFKIKDGDFEITKTIHERLPKWGMLHIAERNYGRDLKKNDILIVKDIEGVEVSYTRSKPLVDFMHKRVKSAYPYVINKKHFNK